MRILTEIWSDLHEFTNKRKKVLERCRRRRSRSEREALREGPNHHQQRAKVLIIHVVGSVGRAFEDVNNICQDRRQQQLRVSE